MYCLFQLPSLPPLAFRALPFAALIACSVGCSAVGDGSEQGSSAPSITEQPTGEIQPEGTSLEVIFAGAAGEFGVPSAILKSVAWAETRLQMVSGESEFPDQEPAYGLMALRGAQLENGAGAAGVSVDAAMHEPEANIRAAAAVMSQHADDLDIERGELSDWAAVVVAYSGIDTMPAQTHFVHEEVFRAIRNGVFTEVVTLEPIEVQPKWALADGPSQPGPDYPAAVWHPSPNHSARPSGYVGDPKMVIIHTCEGSYSGCWGWLTNSGSGVSAHYVVNHTGTEISQLVEESRKGWHIGASYKCSRNSNVECGLNGFGSNNFTIGIEHAGYASQSSWDSGLLHASAELTCDISADHGFPLDQYHVVGHGQLQPYNRVDPGPNWPWSSYLALANDYCNGQVNPPPDPDPDPDPGPDPNDGLLDVIVDSNNNANPGGAECDLSGSWTASNNVSGYYHTGYWWRSTGPTSDLAEFKVHLSEAKNVVVEAWWPAATDRSPAAPFIIYDADGNQLDTVFVNQQQNGSSWVQLGTYALKPGWNVAALSRWTAPGYVVVADAVRFREVP